MGIFLTLRTGPKCNFKDIMLDMIYDSEADEILISSGFFTENDGGFKATEKKSSLNGKNICECLDASKIMSIKIIGCYKSYRHDQSYTDSIYGLHKFAYEIKNNTHGKNVELYESLESWHTKIVLFKDKYGCIAGIIGSSNFTGRGYNDGIPFFSVMNLESDFFIFSEKLKPKMDVTISKIQKRDEENKDNDITTPPSIIVPTYTPAKNGGRTELSILNDCYKTITGLLTPHNFDIYPHAAIKDPT